jgi:hypothetical protein
MTDAKDRIIQKLQIEILLLSLVFLAGGMLWTWQIGQTANNLEHRLHHTSEDLQGLRKNVQKLEEKHT